MVSLFEQDRMKEPEMKPRVALQPKTSKNGQQCVYMPPKNLNYNLKTNPLCEIWSIVEVWAGWECVALCILVWAAKLVNS